MDAQQKLKALLDQLNTVIVGKPAQVRDCVACLLAGGHLLIEDVPGVGKTTLAHALAISLGLRFNRVQFTSDLLPADVAGISVYEREKNGSGSARVTPSALTWRSSIASSRPDWVLGVARLISSASSTWVKIGPGWNTKASCSRW